MSVRVVVLCCAVQIAVGGGRFVTVCRARTICLSACLSLTLAYAIYIASTTAVCMVR